MDALRTRLLLLFGIPERVEAGDRGGLDRGGRAMASCHAVGLMVLSLLGGVLVRGMIVHKILAVDRHAHQGEVTEQDGTDERAAARKAESL